MFKKTLLTGTAILTMLSCGVAKAGEENEGIKFNPILDASSWQIRVRAITLSPDESSTISNGTKANAKHSGYVPEVDFTYFINDNWATELILATTRHDMYAGTTDLGHVWALPPTLTLQYHFDTESDFKPYVGAGVNYTFFYNVKKGAGLTKVTYKDSIGYALQAGTDYMFDDHWGINLDVKKIWLDTDVNVNSGAILGDVDLDPWVIGFGITYKF